MRLQRYNFFRIYARNLETFFTFVVSKLQFCQKGEGKFVDTKKAAVKPLFLFYTIDYQPGF